MDLGLTQQALADRLGCWYQTVASWESDESIPLVGRWPVIEGLLGPGLVPEVDGLAGRIKTARLRLGLTQEDLANLAGIDPRTVRNAELGTRSPSRLTLGKMEAVLGPLPRE